MQKQNNKKKTYYTITIYKNIYKYNKIINMEMITNKKKQKSENQPKKKSPCPLFYDNLEPREHTAA